MKAVMWTDTVQVIIMFVAVAVVGLLNAQRLDLYMMTSTIYRWCLKETLTKVVVHLYGLQTRKLIALNSESMSFPTSFHLNSDGLKNILF